MRTNLPICLECLATTTIAGAAVRIASGRCSAIPRIGRRDHACSLMAQLDDPACQFDCQKFCPRTMAITQGVNPEAAGLPHILKRWLWAVPAVLTERSIDGIS